MKIRGLAVLVTVVAALIGVGSASASVSKSVLCKVHEELCKSANLWGDDSIVIAKSGKTVILGSSFSVTCESTMRLLAEKGEEFVNLGKVTSLTWTNCTGCAELTTTLLPNVSLVTTTDPLVATIETTSEAIVLMKKCPLGIHCTTTANNISFPVTGGTIGGTAKASINGVPLGLSGGLCGSSGKWDAGTTGSSPYVVTSVNSVASGSIFFSLKSHAF